MRRTPGGAASLPNPSAQSQSRSAHGPSLVSIWAVCGALCEPPSCECKSAERHLRICRTPPHLNTIGQGAFGTSGHVGHGIKADRVGIPRQSAACICARSGVCRHPVPRPPSNCAATPRGGSRGQVPVCCPPRPWAAHQSRFRP